MFGMLFALAPAVLVPPVPQISNAVIVQTNAGACGFGGTVTTSAQNRLSWTLVNPNAVDYDIGVYENGVRISGGPGNTTFLDMEITGSVRNGPFSQWNSNWTYRVDVERKSDGVVVASATSNNWNVTYGSC
jgi:hypothetical protein